MSEIIYGPNTEQVTAFIERRKVLTGDEIEKYAAYDAAWYAARESAYDAAREAAWYAADDAARYAARDAACAIVVMDLITAEQFAILTEPFAEILTELGIVWEASKDSK